MDTIFALCSGKGKAGVSVFRISGLYSRLAVARLTKKENANDLKPRYMYVRKIYHPVTLHQIDEALIVYFEEGKSFTGEEVVEIYTHGSIAVTKILLSALLSIPEIRMAEGGEFSKRAFLNGKLDLTRAEGLADLIDAETEMQHKQAIRQMGGGLEKIYEDWRAKLLRIYAFLEAYIDFPDEDIPEELLMDIHQSVANLKEDITKHLSDNNRGERLRDGLRLAIIGKPNVGKSSLLNFLMKREIAIVSEIAGTTRDVIEGHLDIGGYPVILQDTAGIHEANDAIEKEGIKRAKDALKEADIKIIMIDANESDKDHSYFIDLADENTIILLNKIDKVNNASFDLIPGFKPGAHKYLVRTSIKQNIGLDQLLAKISEIAENIASPSEEPQITRARHREALNKALGYLENFSLTNADIVLAAEDIRMTARSVSGITGKITVEELLGEIFGNFCIGK